MKYIFWVLLLNVSYLLKSQNISESQAVKYSINSRSEVAESNNLYCQIKSNNSNKSSFAESTSVYYSIKGKNCSSGESAKVYYSIGTPKVTNLNAKEPEEVLFKTSLEISVPIVNIKRENTFALIIGNEDYKSYQTGLSVEQNVEFAINDSRLFKEVCNKTLGIPTDNTIHIENGSFVKIKQAISQLELICKYSNEKPSIIFYYSGHGLPNEQTKIPYLIPVDVSGTNFDYALSLQDLYKSLTKFPTKEVIVILDACFTGEARNVGLVASRGVKIIPKEENLIGNLVVFSASSSDQPSKAYKEKQHGLFTYYLIQKIIESKGNLTLGELDEYLNNTVPIKSILINKSEQVPKTNVSSDIQNVWKDWKIE